MADTLSLSRREGPSTEHLTPTAVQTGTSYTAANGEMVLVAPTAFQTVTAPPAVVGARFGVKRTNDYNPSANTQIAAGAGNSWVNTDNPPYVRTRDEVVRFRCDVANQWVLEQGGMTSSGAATYMVIATDGRLADARTPLAHAASHAPGGSDALTGYATTTAPRTATAGATVSVDGTAAGNMSLTCTGDTVITVTGTPAYDRTLMIECLASGAARTPAMAASTVMVGVTSRAIAISAAGKVALFGVRYSLLRAAWELIATGVEA